MRNLDIYTKKCKSKNEKMLTLSLLGLFFYSIEYIHGSVRPDCNEIFNSADYAVADFRHGGLLLVGHAAYDEIHLPTFLEIVSDADSDSRIVLCPEEFLNVLKAVVPSVAAFLSHSEGTEWKVQVIADHQDVFYRDVQFVHPVADSVAAEVHISGRLEQCKLSSLE